MSRRLLDSEEPTADPASSSAVMPHRTPSDPGRARHARGHLRHAAEEPHVPRDHQDRRPSAYRRQYRRGDDDGGELQEDRERFARRLGRLKMTSDATPFGPPTVTTRSVTLHQRRAAWRLAFCDTFAKRDELRNLRLLILSRPEAQKKTLVPKPRPSSDGRGFGTNVFFCASVSGDKVGTRRHASIAKSLYGARRS